MYIFEETSYIFTLYSWKMKFTNFKISRGSISPLENIAHVSSRKIFYHMSAHFRNPGFRSVSKPQKPVFTFRTGPTTNVEILTQYLKYAEDQTYHCKKIKNEIIQNVYNCGLQEMGTTQNT